MQFVRPNMLDENSLIMDIRTPQEYEEEKLLLPHIHIDFETWNIDDVIKKYQFDNSKTINILCSSGGGRAETAAQELEEHGIDNVAIVLGGMDGIKYDHVPTEKH